MFPVDCCCSKWRLSSWRSQRNYGYQYVEANNIASYPEAMTGSALIQLATNDIVRVVCKQDSGSGLDISGTDSGLCV